MKILVTGGTGVVGRSAVSELLARGHSVRLLSRHAENEARQWDGVEPFAGNVADTTSIRGSMGGCDAVLHIAGIVAEEPPELTFAKVNVGGTRNIVDEAARSGVRRLIFISSLGADRGSSGYHASKREAESVVRESPLGWTILRPGNVYGPGDEVLSTVLKMVRALPAVPVIDGGDQKFQPLWHEDLARAIAAILENAESSGQVFELAGPDVTTMNDVLERLAKITGREPVRVPVPMAIASLSTKLAGMAIDLPIDDNKLTMLGEENVVRGVNALASLTGQPLVDLDAGLRLLADALPEQLPEDGVGSMQHKTFSGVIRGTSKRPEEVMEVFRTRVVDIMPLEFAAEPDAPTRLDEGATLTGSMPLRGHFQVRVEKVEPRRVILATIEGHPLAGTVSFSTADAVDGVRFSIDIDSRSGNFLDMIAMRTIGALAQDANWRSVVKRTGEAVGGHVDEVESGSRKVSREEAGSREEAQRNLVQERQRNEHRA